MQEGTLILVTFAVTLGLLVSMTMIIFLLLMQYSKRRIADQLILRQMEDRYEKELLKTQLEVQDQTIEHISRELHDNIGSSISIARAHLNSDAPLLEKIKNASDILKIAQDDVRGISRGMSIEAIRANGLTKAIDGVAGQLRKIGQYQVAYEVIGNYHLLDEKIEIIAFRILQESINNIIKHADATKIEIIMNCKPDGMCLYIQDNGNGFDSAGPTKPGGLSNMRMRADLIDASFKIEHPTTGGTKISLCIPLTSIPRK
jgi:two-component system, NarL family, sensor kinase